jgi:hypothetical protein
MTVKSESDESRANFFVSLFTSLAFLLIPPLFTAPQQRYTLQISATDRVAKTTVMQKALFAIE